MSDDDAHNEELIRKVDALLSRHRIPEESALFESLMRPDAGPETADMPNESPPDDDYPILTDVVVPAPPLFGTHDPSEADGTAAPGSDPNNSGVLALTSEQDAAPSAVIPHEQIENVEQQVYLKLRASLDEHIAQVIETHFVPAIGSALNVRKS